ncbi:MAG: hypothetical protein MUF70_14835 [Myxococcota bacterium]|nr:hypothetical protein [Myxococcota bacterium]
MTRAPGPGFQDPSQRERKRRDLAVEGGARRALRRAKGGRIHGLRPDEQVQRSARQGIGRERKVRVEDRTRRVVGAELRAHAGVVADVGLDQAGAQRRRSCVARFERMEPPRAVAEERRDDPERRQRRRCGAADVMSPRRAQ